MNPRLLSPANLFLQNGDFYLILLIMGVPIWSYIHRGRPLDQGKFIVMTAHWWKPLWSPNKSQKASKSCYKSGSPMSEHCCSTPSSTASSWSRMPSEQRRSSLCIFCPSTTRLLEEFIPVRDTFCPCHVKLMCRDAKFHKYGAEGLEPLGPKDCVIPLEVNEKKF
jgi:hypothetical protein